jgi:hypothetical protein
MYVFYTCVYIHYNLMEYSHKNQELKRIIFFERMEYMLIMEGR